MNLWFAGLDRPADFYNLQKQRTMSEIWKDIAGYEQFYQVSNFGRVKSLARVTTRKLRGKILSAGISDGYCLVLLSQNAVQKSYRVHRLVAEAFIPNPENKPHVNHKNGNRADNCVGNLEWCTSSENNLHACRILDKKQPKQPSGKNNPLSKPVLCYSKDGVFVAEYGCVKEAERITGIPERNIRNVCKMERRIAGGYVWKYK